MRMLPIINRALMGTISQRAMWNAALQGTNKPYNTQIDGKKAAGLMRACMSLGIPFGDTSGIIITAGFELGILRAEPIDKRKPSGAYRIVYANERKLK